MKTRYQVLKTFNHHHLQTYRFPNSTQQTHDITNPNYTLLLRVSSFKFTLHLQCLIYPKWAIWWSLRWIRQYKPQISPSFCQGATNSLNVQSWHMKPRKLEAIQAKFHLMKLRRMKVGDWDYTSGETGLKLHQTLHGPAMFRCVLDRKSVV